MAGSRHALTPRLKSLVTRLSSALLARVCTSIRLHSNFLQYSCEVIGMQGDADNVQSGEQLSTMLGSRLLSLTPDSLRSAVNVNKTDIARRYVTALNSEQDARSHRPQTGGRAARRRADRRRARRPTPTTAAVADLVSLPAATIDH